MSNIITENLKDIGVKRQRFIKVAESRVNRILDGLDNLEKCSNKRNYDYSEGEVKKIFREIDRKVREVKMQFQDKNNKGKRFKLL